MAGLQDSYELWLGVQTDVRPPNYYDLLSLPLYCAEPPVIADALETAEAMIEAQLAGPDAAEAERLWGEVQQARTTLLNATQRRQYEESLQNPGPAQPVAGAVVAPAAIAPAMMAPAAASVPQASPFSYAALAASAIPRAVNPSAAPVPAANAFPAEAAFPAANAFPAAPFPAATPLAGQIPAAQPFGMPGGAPVVTAMPVQGYPSAIPAAPAYGYGGGMAIPQAAPFQPASPLGNGFNPNSTAATNVNYRRKRTNQNRFALQLVGGALVLLIGVLVFKYRDNLTPTPTRAPVAAAPEFVYPEPGARPDLSRMVGTRPAGSTPPKTHETAALVNDAAKALERAAVMPAPPAVDKFFGVKPGEKSNPGMSSSMPDNEPPKKTTTSTTPTPAMTTPAVTEPPEKMKKEESKADASEAKAIKKQLDDARTALRTYKLDKALEALDLATLEATADDSNNSIKRMKSVVDANQKFWESVTAAAKGLAAKEELKAGDEVLGTVVSVDDNKAVVMFEGRNQTVNFKTPEKASPKLLTWLAEKTLGPGSPEANVCVAAYLMSAPAPNGDRELARTKLQSANGPDAELLLAELDAQMN